MFLVARAGAGKTRAIVEMTKLLRPLPEVTFAPTSVTGASLVDRLFESVKSDTGDWKAGSMTQYNAMYIAVDELQALMPTWNEHLVAALTKFYDGHHYSESRRTNKVNIEIDKPNLNIICGTTPSHLLTIVKPEGWEQGLMSRVILVNSDKSKFRDTFSIPINRQKLEDELVYDLQIIAKGTRGAFKWTPAWQEAFHVWRAAGCKPVPNHPRLADYTARRYTHLIKLAIVAAVDRDSVVLDKQDFDTALAWMTENELDMHLIFDSGATSVDDAAINDIAHFVRQQGEVMQHKLLRYAQNKLPAYMIERVVGLLMQQGRIRVVGTDERTKKPIFGPGDD